MRKQGEQGTKKEDMTRLANVEALGAHVKCQMESSIAHRIKTKPQVGRAVSI